MTKLELLIETIEETGVIVNRGTDDNGRTWTCIRLDGGVDVVFYDEDFDSILVGGAI